MPLCFPSHIIIPHMVYHLIPNSLCRHRWSRVSIIYRSLLVPSTRRWVECKYYTGGCGDSWLPYLAVQVLHSCTNDGITMWDIRRALSCWADKRAKIDKFFHYRNLLPLDYDCRWLILPAAQRLNCQFTSSPRDAGRKHKIEQYSRFMTHSILGCVNKAQWWKPDLVSIAALLLYFISETFFMLYYHVCF